MNSVWISDRYRPDETKPNLRQRNNPHRWQLSTSRSTRRVNVAVIRPYRDGGRIFDEFRFFCVPMRWNHEQLCRVQIR
jgi:hypothetical protein